MKQLLKRIRKGEQPISMRFFVCIVIVVIASVSGVFLLMPKEESEAQTLPWQQSIDIVSSSVGSEQTSAVGEKSSLELKEMVIVVDIKGEVNKPGVYELKENDRIQQAIDAAGGFTDDADQALINLAQKVSDQMMIVVPTKQADGSASGNGGEVVPIVTQTVADSSQTKLVNINTATLDELMTLSGIGQKKAEQIIAYREENGSFKTVEELTNVQGFGERTIERLKSEITVQ